MNKNPRAINIKHWHKVMIGCIIMFVAPFAVRGETCETVDKIPADTKQVASGVANPSPFSTKFTGGQGVFVRVRNDTVHLTPLIVTITDGKSHEYCSSSLIIPPQKILIFNTAVFDSKVDWGVRVEPGDVDVVQLTVNVYTTSSP